MPDFCTCGAQLPLEARFCHKCGKPQYDYPATQPEDAAESPAPATEVPPPLPAAPAEIGFHNRVAVRIGFLAALSAVLLFLFPLPFPILRLPVAFVAAGFLAVYLYTRRTGQALSIRSGARMGWITGIFSFAMITIIFTAAIVAVSNQGGLAAFFREHRDQMLTTSAQSDAFVHALDDPAALVGGLLLSLVMLFVILTILPTLGGALGAKVLTKNDA